MQWIDVSADPDAAARARHADVVGALRSLGFVELGLVRAETGVPHEQTARVYREPDRTWFLEHAADPATMLRDPDGIAFAEVSSFFGGPAVRLRTLLVDGRLVETRKQWQRVPELDPDVVPWGHQERVAEQQRIGHARGRSIEVVDTGDIGELVGAHRAHVIRFTGGAAVRAHDALDVAIQISRRAFEQATAVHLRRRAVAVGALWALAAGVLSAVALAMWTGSPWVALALAVGAVWAGSAWAPRAARWVAIRIVRRFPPPFT